MFAGKHKILCFTKYQIFMNMKDPPPNRININAEHCIFQFDKVQYKNV